MKLIDNDKLIAPCGMNCGICMVYLRERNKCKGCRASDVGKPVTRTECKIKTCEKRASERKTCEKEEFEFCFECSEFPCKRLNQLDNRYRRKYRMSMIENLIAIRDGGISGFLASEAERWRCRNCGEVINVHKGGCSVCGSELEKLVTNEE